MPSSMSMYRERRFYMKVCACGCSTGYAPPRRKGSSPIPSAKTCATLPRISARSSACLTNVCNCCSHPCSMSQSVKGLLWPKLPGMLEKSMSVIDLIGPLIKKSSVVGFDESKCYCKSTLNWSWMEQTTHLMLVFRCAGRVQSS